MLISWMGLGGLCVIGVLIGFFSTTATLMSLLPEGELPDDCKDGGVLERNEYAWMNKYAWRLLHF